VGEEGGGVVNTKPLICTDDQVQVDFAFFFHLAQRGAFDINTLNGWWDDRNRIMMSGANNAMPIVVTGCLGLVATEVSEAIEAVRKHDPSTWADANTKDTLVRELAGTVVRCMDLAERLGLPLAEAIVEEIKANAERGYRHGGKAA
jgi:NTP pyrophosphatase (non-canonical NTP hydrolase)